MTLAYFWTCAPSVPFTFMYIEQGLVTSLFRAFANLCPRASPFVLGLLPVPLP